MKRFLLFVFALAWVAGASAQKTITPEGADETVRLWDNTTAKYSNYETRDEKWEKPNRMIRTSSCDLCIYKADPECNTGICIVMFPGGGYTKLALGNHSAKWLALTHISLMHLHIFKNRANTRFHANMLARKNLISALPKKSHIFQNTKWLCQR